MAAEGEHIKPAAPHLPAQHNLQDATRLALARLSGQSEEQLLWLGASQTQAGHRSVPVLNANLLVDVLSGAVLTDEGVEAGPQWRILVLHYLCCTARPAGLEPSVAFADISSTRVYAGVYGKRVTDRLCAAAGRDIKTLRAGAEALGSRFVKGGDLAFDLPAFPRLTVRVIWHAADEEFPPSATLLFPSNIEAFFCAEDIVVLAERLVSRLSGGRF
ncbi:MAG: DUF3786 domain-containing protein [Planctomycetes bacterium]|nr:DUF3786 domain-containing protein [Planctomycetota bacterium]